jgi:hypothetical protein
VGCHQKQAPSLEDGLNCLTLPGPEARVPEPHQRGVKIDGTVGSGSGHTHKFARQQPRAPTISAQHRAKPRLKAVAGKK